MIDLVQGWFSESAKAQERLVEAQGQTILAAAELIADAFSAGRKLLILGNGGSAADAQHLAAEFVNRFRIERPPLPAMALTTDTSVITSIANDYSFDDIFVKQIKALAKAGDVVLAISTSGRSLNVLNAVREAAARGARTVALTGKDGGLLAAEGELAIVVPAESTPIIQECHLIVEHLICELVDAILFTHPEGAVD